MLNNESIIHLHFLWSHPPRSSGVEMSWSPASSFIRVLIGMQISRVIIVITTVIKPLSPLSTSWRNLSALKKEPQTVPHRPADSGTCLTARSWNASQETGQPSEAVHRGCFQVCSKPLALCGVLWHIWKAEFHLRRFTWGSQLWSVFHVSFPLIRWVALRWTGWGLPDCVCLCGKKRQPQWAPPSSSSPFYCQVKRTVWVGPNDTFTAAHRSNVQK